MGSSARASVCYVVITTFPELPFLFFFFFNDTATTEIYTLSLHDALPILMLPELPEARMETRKPIVWLLELTVSSLPPSVDRKSTRLNSSHSQISYAVFCLKKKNGGFAVDGKYHKRY